MEEPLSRPTLPLSHRFLLVIATLFLIATISYSTYLVDHLVFVATTIERPLADLHTEAALIHLWTEETLTGDTTYTPEQIIRRYFDFTAHIEDLNTQLLTRWKDSYLKGQKNLPEMLAVIKNRAELSRQIAVKRFDNPANSQPGSLLDDEQDANFASLSDEIVKFTRAMDESITTYQQKVRIFRWIMIVVTLALSGWVVDVLLRYDRQRREDILTIASHNQHLQAANQQLTATEQQLRASNQQLMATEQQLRASNQQLMATEQQLLATVQQLSANEQELKTRNSELQASQLILEKSESRYRNLIGNMAEGVAIHSLEFDGDGKATNYRVVEINAQYEAILGMKRENVAGLLATTVYGVAEAPYLADFSAVALGGPSIRFETFYPPMQRHFSISVSSFELGMFVTVFSDITERKKAEVAARLNEARLESLLEISQYQVSSPSQLLTHALEKVLDLTGSTHGGIFLLDSDKGQWVCTAKVCLVAGGCQGSLESKDGCSIERVGVLQEVLEKRSVVFWQEASHNFGIPSLNTKQPCNRILAVPMFVEEQMTAVVVLADKDSAYDNADIRQTTLLMDVVLRMDALQRAAEEKSRLAVRMQKLESLGVLAGGIAHDFNNMLTAILANINLATLMGAMSPEVLGRLQEAEKATLRAKGLTQQLLTFAKGGAPIRKVTSLPELVRETATFAARGSHVRCEFIMAEDLRPVEIDAGQIGQVINNLVMNAVQAMPEGGVIIISADNTRIEKDGDVPVTGGDYVRLTFHDHGIGIAAAHLEKIFDPYFTTKTKGTGLGLTASHTIVQNHQGAIFVESTEGEGTVFTIYLPASKNVVAVEDASTTTPGKGSGRILVMDDEPTLRNLLGRILEISGYEPTLVGDGKEAVVKYREAFVAGEGFDAVILDLTVVGGMGGKEALVALRQINPAVRAIVSSGYSDDPVMAEYRNYGFSGVIAKPYTVEEMRAVLHRVIDTDRETG